MGNITVKRPPINIKKRLLAENGIVLEEEEGTEKNFLANENVYSLSKEREFKQSSKPPFTYYNTLDTKDNYQGAACFKSREYYRLGVQFQYKNG